MEKILQNKNIVLTRAKDQSVQSVMDLEALGANVISFPTIKISPITNNQILDDTVSNINNFNTIIFTSENAVKSLLVKIDELRVNFDPKAFFVISIGDKTTESCISNNFRVDFQPQNASSESLLKELEFMNLVGRKILVPGSSLSKPDQFNSLENYGAEITSIPIYENKTNDVQNLGDEIEQLKSREIDLYIFTSPSTFSGFLTIMSIDNPEQYFENKNIAVIGPVTKEALNKAGIEPNIVPPNFTMNYLIEEIKKFYSKEKVID